MNKQDCQHLDCPPDDLECQERNKQTGEAGGIKKCPKCGSENCKWWKGLNKFGEAVNFYQDCPNCDFSVHLDGCFILGDHHLL